MSRKKNIYALILSMVLAVSMVIPSFATSVTELENETQKLQNQLSNINSEILEVNQELESILQQIETTENTIQRTREELEKSKEEEQKQYQDMKTRIRYMYEAGNTSFLELLFGAEDMADFVNRSDFINNVTDYDREMLQEFITVREKIEEEEKDLEGEQAALELLKSESEAKEAQLQATAQATSTDLAAVRSQLQQAKAEQAAAQAEQESAGSQSGSSSSSSSGGTSNSGPSYSGEADEVDLFAALLDCEAISDYNSRLAVATVIMNRVNSGNFPNTIRSVIYQKGQFSPTWTGKLDRKLASGASSLSYKVAKAAMNGERLSSVSHCYYFLYEPATNRQGVVVGDNVFFAKW